MEKYQFSLYYPLLLSLTVYGYCHPMNLPTPFAEEFSRLQNCRHMIVGFHGLVMSEEVALSGTLTTFAYLQVAS